MNAGISAILIPMCVIAASAGTGLGDEPKPKIQMRDVATHDTLSRTLQAANNRDPMLDVKISEVSDPSKNAVQTDILDRSDIISFNGLTTLVPKRAILTLPEALASRVGTHAPGHRIVHWSEFLIANRGWITTLEVSRAQAEGNAPLPTESRERISKSSAMIIATYQGGPISVLPLKEPETESESQSQPEE